MSKTGVVIPNGVVRERLADKVTCEPRPEGGKEEPPGHLERDGSCKGCSILGVLEGWQGGKGLEQRVREGESGGNRAESAMELDHTGPGGPSEAFTLYSE